MPALVVATVDSVICMDLHYSVQTESSVVRKLESPLDGSFFCIIT